jgi:hypothetical protein
MTTHLELLRTIVTHTVHEPPPGKLLVGQEANRWARALAFWRAQVSGERVGVRRDGVAAAIKLARSLAKDNPQYRRGARYMTLTQAILNASMEKFTGLLMKTACAMCGRSRSAMNCPRPVNRRQSSRRGRERPTKGDCEAGFITRLRSRRLLLPSASAYLVHGKYLQTKPFIMC